MYEEVGKFMMHISMDVTEGVGITNFQSIYWDEDNPPDYIYKDNGVLVLENYKDNIYMVGDETV